MEFAFELPEPITDIFNRSFSIYTSTIPSIWKCADIVSTRKENPPKEEFNVILDQFPWQLPF